MWKKILLNETASTNEDAKKQVSSGEEYFNYVICAKKQTKGKGRYDRIWESPEGNLYCSFITENKNPSYQSFVSAIAIIEAIKEVCPDIDIACKWPNDVLVGGAKISGILLEVYENALIIGIGVNIRSCPQHSAYPTTYLNKYNEKINSEVFLKILGDKLYSNINTLHTLGFEQIREKWLGYAYNIGKEIKVNLINESTIGIFKGISEQGALLIDTGNEIKRIMAGDVFYL